MPKIAERLAHQLAAKGEKNSKGMAYALLNKRGQMKGNELTAKGKERQAMGASGRAKDRAAKAGGGDASAYTYDPRTNRARKK